MAYNLIATERAENLLDKIINYMLYHLKNEQAASHLLDSVEKYMKDWKKIRVNL